MSEKATKNGTESYAERFRGRAADGHFREAQGLLLSSLGIGTYLGQPDERTDAAYSSAIVTAVENGINVIDAAINYRFQRSERSIGAALIQLEEKGFSREQVVLCTKAGYLTPDGRMPSDPNRYFFEEYIQRGIFQAKDIAAGSLQASVQPTGIGHQLLSAWNALQHVLNKLAHGGPLVPLTVPVSPRLRRTLKAYLENPVTMLA